MVLNTKAYDLFKWLTLIVLPAVAVFYLACGNLWDFTEPSKVSGTIMLIDALLGALLQLSNAQFKASPQSVDGYVTPTGTDPDTGIPNMQFTISRHPVDFLNQGVVRMKVGHPPAQPTLRKPLPNDGNGFRDGNNASNENNL